MKLTILVLLIALMFQHNAPVVESVCLTTGQSDNNQLSTKIRKIPTTLPTTTAVKILLIFVLEIAI